MGFRIAAMPISPTELYDLVRAGRPGRAPRAHEEWSCCVKLDGSCRPARPAGAGVGGDHRSGGAGADHPRLRVAGNRAGEDDYR